MKLFKVYGSLPAFVSNIIQLCFNCYIFEQIILKGFCGIAVTSVMLSYLYRMGETRSSMTLRKGHWTPFSLRTRFHFGETLREHFSAVGVPKSKGAGPKIPYFSLKLLLLVTIKTFQPFRMGEKAQKQVNHQMISDFWKGVELGEGVIVTWGTQAGLIWRLDPRFSTPALRNESVTWLLFF